jgi:alkanesulfonate monooxygenase SsuD/methylene tetrahydromethanopterin reductase-like flavin-dependent oxidoreductase (luciferase family)
MWFYVTENRSEADAIFRDRLVPTVNRPEKVLRERLAVGPPEAFAEKLAAFRAAGVHRVLIWPVQDEVRQLELFAEKVRPVVSD